MWMVRAEGGSLIEKFRLGVVALGWHLTGDLVNVRSRDQMRGLCERIYPDWGPGKLTNAIGVLFKFRNTFKKGDKVVTYDPSSREYLFGEIVSDYRFSKSELGDECPHLGDVKWLGNITRDSLSLASRNTLASTLTVFALNDDVASELKQVLNGVTVTQPSFPLLSKEELSSIKEDESAKAFELIKDTILSLSDRSIEHLTAAILRAMGYRARVTPIGPDRGVDVVASPDGLGLEEPRIKAEVKHRGGAIGAPDVRSFIGGLRAGDRGLYVSTGGFTKEAKYEAERSTIAVTLVDLGTLASLVITHYEDFDVEGRVILPLVRVYLPAE